MSTEAVQAARKRLDEELAYVQDELAQMGFATDGSVEVNFDEGFADAAQTTSERAKVLSLADGLRQRLEDTRAAIGRLEKGTYGICESCGKDIAPERLEAVPTASLCIDCKQKADKAR
ncbi:MAG: TraR/DksA C4-type zinc finger protein [Actinobacteria bacterium]|nr:TraR/DksA C4-type zinc finger protein [Actinomycetota bacterium]